MDKPTTIPPINKGNVTFNSPVEAFFQMPWPRKPMGKGGPGKPSHGMAKGGRGRSKMGRSKKSY
jgi:hypothetical protein